PALRQPEAIGLEIAPALTAVSLDVRRMTLAGIRIVDPGGVIVVWTSADDGKLSLAGQEEVAQALKGRPATRLRERATPLAGLGWESNSRNRGLRALCD